MDNCKIPEKDPEEKKKLIQENEKKIKQSQDNIRLINLEFLAENLYNACLGKFMWRGTKLKEKPFYIMNRGTHGDYEIIIPNVCEVYNVSDNSIKKKMIDSVCWVIKNFNKKVEGEWDYKEDKPLYDKISLLAIGSLVSSFSGQEIYPLDVHEIYGLHYRVEEKSQKMRNYIKDNFRKSLLSLFKTEDYNHYSNNYVKKPFYIDPMEIMPLEYWHKEISAGNGLDVIYHRFSAGSFFGEEKILTNINEYIKHGLTLDTLKKNYSIEDLHYSTWLISNESKYRDFLEKIEDPKLKSSFISLFNKTIKSTNENLEKLTSSLKK